MQIACSENTPLGLARLAARRVHEGSKFLRRVPSCGPRTRFHKAKRRFTSALKAAGLVESVQVEYQGANRLERLTFNLAGELYCWHIPHGSRAGDDAQFIGPRREWRNKRARPAKFKKSTAAPIAPEVEEWIAEAIELLELASQTLTVGN